MRHRYTWALLVVIGLLVLSGSAIWLSSHNRSVGAPAAIARSPGGGSSPEPSRVSGTTVSPSSAVVAGAPTFTPVPETPRPRFEYVAIDPANAGDCKMVGDIDGDGYPDLLIAGKPEEKLSWYRYPDWKKTVIATPNIEFTTDGAVVDVDGDGDLDIVVPDGNQGANLLWFENPRPTGDPGSGSAWRRRVIGSIGGWGKDVRLADYDGDGLIDVATRSRDEAMVFFQTRPDVWQHVALPSVTLGSEGMAQGDVDGDGDEDLILRGVWLENPGSPARDGKKWTQHRIGPANTDFKALVADINGDGAMDVLFSSSENSDDVNWWSAENGNPRGQWIPHTIMPQVEQAHTLQAADMDGDGDTDVVVGQMHTSAAKELAIFYNDDGAGTRWGRVVVGKLGLHNGVVADIGNDGDYDIFGANWTGNPPVQLWVNQKNAWTYKQVTQEHQQTFGLTFADIDRDGRLDIVSGLYWYLNPGGDLLDDWVQSPLPEGMHAALSLDVDGDEHPDLIAQTDEGDIGLYWLESDDGGTTWNAVAFGSVPRASHGLGAQGYRVAQVEAGGRPEVLFSSGQGIFYFRIPAEPTGGAWPRVQISPRPSDEGFALGDIDRDGDLDMISTTGEAKGVEWYRNPGAPAEEWASIPIGGVPEVVFPDRTEVADFNGDGLLDVVVTEENGSERDAKTFWWAQPQEEGEVWVRSLVTAQASTNSLDVADIDHDGKIDLVLGEQRGRKRLAVWYNDGNGVFTEQPVDDGKESHLGGRTIDLDGDGDLDLASIAWDDYHYIHIWRNN